jgi:hypothetical protein
MILVRYLHLVVLREKKTIAICFMLGYSAIAKECLLIRGIDEFINLKLSGLLLKKILHDRIQKVMFIK